jgi:hypothetical protein
MAKEHSLATDIGRDAEVRKETVGPVREKLPKWKNQVRACLDLCKKGKHQHVKSKTGELLGT